MAASTARCRCNTGAKCKCAINWKSYDERASGGAAVAAVAASGAPHGV